MSFESIMTDPDVGWSRQPMICRSVLLPLPLAPVIATSSPLAIDSDTLESADIICLPSLYVFETFFSDMISSAVG